MSKLYSSIATPTDGFFQSINSATSRSLSCCVRLNVSIASGRPSHRGVCRLCTSLATERIASSHLPVGVEVERRNRRPVLKLGAYSCMHRCVVVRCMSNHSITVPTLLREDEAQLRAVEVLL